MPDHAGRQSLLDCYFQCIHPLMPLLDKPSVLKAFHESFQVDKDPDNDLRMSLLLVQAIFFVASAVSIM